MMGSVGCPPGPPPFTPINFYAVPGDTQVTLSWNRDSLPAVSNYEIAWGTNVLQLDNTLVVLGSLSRHTVANLTNGTTYYFGLTAIDGHGQRSVQTAIVSAIPQPVNGGD